MGVSKIRRDAEGLRVRGERIVISREQIEGGTSVMIDIGVGGPKRQGLRVSFKGVVEPSAITERLADIVVGLGLVGR